MANCGTEDARSHPSGAWLGRGPFAFAGCHFRSELKTDRLRFGQQHSSVPVSYAHQLPAKHKERSAQQAEGGPKVIPVWLFFQVEPGKGDEHRQGDHFLQDLQLPDVHDLIADPVCGDLNQILEQCDSPADEGSEPPGFVLEVLKMAVPRDGHEDVARGQHDDGQ